MKTTFTFLALLMGSTLLFSQSSDVSVDATIPDPVMDKFTLLYPDAKGIAWEVDNETYVAEFKNGKMATSATIDEDGKVLETKTEINIIALPEAATSYLLDELQCKKIVEVTIIEDVEGGIIFEAKADKVDYKFDWSGQLLIGDEIAIAPRK
jgi:hypothetical protein